MLERGRPRDEDGRGRWFFPVFTKTGKIGSNFVKEKKKRFALNIFFNKNLPKKTEQFVLSCKPWDTSEIDNKPYLVSGITS